MPGGSPIMKRYVQLLATVVGPQRRALPGILVRFVLLSILEAVGVSLVLPVISSLGLGRSGSNVAPDGIFAFVSGYAALAGLKPTSALMLLLVAVFYFKAVFGYWMQREILRFGYANQKRLIDTMVLQYEMISVSDSVKTETSEMVQNLIVNVELVCIATIVAAIRLLAELFVIIALALVLVWMQPVISLITVVMIVSILFTYDVFVRARLHKTGEVAARHRSRVIKGFQDVMSGLREIRVIGGLDFFNRQIFESTEAVKEASVNYKALNVVPRYLVESMAVTAFAAVFLISEWLRLPKVEIIGLIAMFAVAAIRLIPGTSQVVASIVQMRNSYYPLQKVYEGIVSAQSTSLGHSGHVEGTNRCAESPFDVTHPPRRIELRDVTFSYRDRPDPVLSRASLLIKQGSLVCLRGESGSGKTTTFDLILGFLDPNAGSVLADGLDIRQFGDSWRSLFVVVPQNPFLFSGTIRENITLESVPQADGATRLARAIDLACLREFIDAIPDGIDAKLDERGENLAGGQRQRIALARAFYLDRSVYLLDEPTSALDRDTADRLLNNLVSLRGSKTVVVASHDPNVQARCDQLFEFGAQTINTRMMGAAAVAT